MKFFDNPLVKCPLCNGENISDKFTIHRFSPEFNISECKNCNFQFMNPPFSDKQMATLYSEDYYNGSADFAYHDERKMIKYSRYVWNARLKKIHRYVKGGNFLDIGASFGGFMEAAEKYYHSHGIEISPYSAEYSKKIFGERLHQGRVENHPFEKNFFTVITMVEVIEHIKSPVKTLKECYDLLKPGGVMVIQTANLNAWQAINEGENYHYYLPGHFSYFSEENLKAALSEIGFSKFKSFFPVDFGLLPKLRKSRGNFKKLRDYLKWINISRYHFKSLFKSKGKRKTSSMVIYAFK